LNDMSRSDPFRERAYSLETLPDDVAALQEYLAVVQELIADMGHEIGEDWDQEQQARSELEVLQLLESEISLKVAESRADCLSAVLRKLAIWDMLRATEADAEETAARDRVVHSIREDIEHLIAA
jgi:hypothetical protein